MIGDGNITIELDGEEIILTPTLNACLDLSRRSDGIRSLQDRILKLDLDAYCTIISVGSGKKNNKKLQTAIYKNGMVPLADPLISFTNIIANGGKPLDDSEEQEGSEDDPK